MRGFFEVGTPMGKSEARFEELMDALDEQFPGPQKPWKRLFEEDREFNQGPFAETMRDQYLAERLEKSAALEARLRSAVDEDGLLFAPTIANVLRETGPTATMDEIRAGVEFALAGAEHVTPVVAAKRLARASVKQEALAMRIGKRTVGASGGSFCAAM